MFGTRIFQFGFVCPLQTFCVSLTNVVSHSESQLTRSESIELGSWNPLSHYPVTHKVCLSRPTVWYPTTGGRSSSLRRRLTRTSSLDGRPSETRPRSTYPVRDVGVITLIVPSGTRPGRSSLRGSKPPDDISPSGRDHCHSGHCE